MFKSIHTRDYSSVKANTISALPFLELSDECTYANFDSMVDDWIKTYGIANKPWVYPQALAHVSKWTLSRGEDGLFDPKALVRDNCKDDPLNRGIYWFLMSKHRAIKRQYADTAYCSMVPLILAAFKKYSDIKYSSWNADNLHYVVGVDLLTAMKTVPPEYSKDELLQFRVDGLTASDTSKRTPGAAKSPVSTYNLYRLPKEMEDGRVGPGELPPLVRMMLCQTWCAHPSNRNPYMILDPLNWDRMPEPLITTDILTVAAINDLDNIWK